MAVVELLPGLAAVLGRLRRGLHPEHAAVHPADRDAEAVEREVVGADGVVRRVR